jgi:gamma-glutamylcyclotransferase
MNRRLCFIILLFAGLVPSSFPFTGARLLGIGTLPLTAAAWPAADTQTRLHAQNSEGERLRPPRTYGQGFFTEFQQSLRVGIGSTLENLQHISWWGQTLGASNAAVLPFLPVVILLRGIVRLKQPRKSLIGRPDRDAGNHGTRGTTNRQHTPTTKYLAYGSNMLYERLHDRVRAWNPTPCGLQGYRMLFNKRSTDQSGKCNLVFTGHPSDVVYGVLYDVSSDDVARLDSYEGVGAGYMRKTCRFPLDGIEQEAFFYVADTGHTDDDLLPYQWYLDLVVAGAEQNGLPPEYISALRSAKCAPDPQPHRKTRSEALDALARYSQTRSRDS